MWIVRLALSRMYTIAVMALLILLLGVVAVRQTPTDIFPNIDIPVITVVWSYRGLSTEEMEKMITTFSEYSISSNVNDISNIESQTINGISVIKIFFHPGVKIEEALAQVTSISQSIRIRMPPGTQPPIIIRYNASDVPVLQLSLSSDSLSESQIYDYGQYRMRQLIAGIRGTRLPTPYGGSFRQIMVDLLPEQLLAHGVTPLEVLQAVNAQNLTLPSGSAKLGTQEYTVRLNSKPEIVESLGDIPLRQVNGTTVFLRDVAQVRDGSAVKTNTVKRDGQKGSLMTILKTGATSTITVVDQLREQVLPESRAAAPPGLKIEALFDQSVFVRASVKGVLVEGLVAACLTATMILLFLGSWRSTLIVAVSIPLSILVSLTTLYALGYTLNIMTLGGLALAIGILVDDATVEIENVHRNMHLGKDLRTAILDGAQQIATPTLVATLTICIVFVSVEFLTGPARFLFTPMALAVVFAMLASYLLSRTLVPTLILLMLPKEAADIQRESQGLPPEHPNLMQRLSHRFNHGFEGLRRSYSDLLTAALGRRGVVLGVFGAVVLVAAVLLPYVGQDFFPSVDAGQFRLHLRAPAGSRLEETERLAALAERQIRQVIPADELDIVLSNIGLNDVAYNLAFSDGATLGVADAEILVALKEERRQPTPEYVKQLRIRLQRELPEVEVFFQNADIVGQILNFGLTAPIDIQVGGSDRANNLRIARQIRDRVALLRGTVDVHLHQVTAAPELFVEVDRTRAGQLGLDEQTIANNLMVALSSSGQVTPNFWPDPVSGVPYLLAVQTPQYRIQELADLEQTPVHRTSEGGAPQLLANVATVRRRVSPMVVNHNNIQPAYDVYASVQDRDLGGVARDIQQVITELTPQLKPGNRIILRGQVESMNSAFERLGLGLIFAVLLVYLLMVVNFQSWRTPFIIITALPGALCGIVWLLFLTGTTFSIPSLMGAIMCVGVASANSILLVTFANERLAEGDTPLAAALEAGRTRLRPILMTALAMIIGMLPMSLGLGEGGEQNAPLGRAVIGGLLMATVSTLFFVPTIFSYLASSVQPASPPSPTSSPSPSHGN